MLVQEEGVKHLISFYQNHTFSNQGIDVFDKDAFKKLQQLETTLRIERELKQRMTERSAKAFYKEFGKMVENADVIIQVLIFYCTFSPINIAHTKMLI